MGKKTIILWAAALGALGLVICVPAVIIIDAKRDAFKRQRAKDVAAHVEQLTRDYQSYLDQTAETIKGLPADPHAVGAIQAKHLRELPARALYVWATANDGRLAFGVPGDAFLRLNNAFDQQQSVIARDNHYTTRDQFLRALLHETRPITLDTSEDEAGGRRASGDKEWWRFFRERDRHSDGHILFLSTPIQDAKGTTVGNLNLKLVDETDERTEDAAWGHTLWQVQEALLPPIVFCILWLWFLLPSWVYVDAQERGMPRPALWALLTLVGSVFALLVYLISRPAAPAELRCPKCAKALNGVKTGCPYCGVDLSSAFCAQCQYPLASDWAFCPACRSAIGKPAAPESA
jgi:hypothetical protein